MVAMIMKNTARKSVKQGEYGAEHIGAVRGCQSRKLLLMTI
jgi:hypothetical protein